MSKLLRAAALVPLAGSLATSLALPVLLAACSNDPTSDGPNSSPNRVPAEIAGTFRHYGAALEVGNGRARAYVVLDEQNANRPLEVGVALDATAMNGLPAPTAPAPGTDPHAHVDTKEYLLTLPAQHGTPYQFITLDWNASGHEPPGIYDLPHFDFHFYTISPAEREAILPTDPAFAQKAANFPTAAYVPAGYMVLPPPPAPVNAVPRMGVHWLDVASPELQAPTSPNYKAFTYTFIHGSWNGQFIFDEPMITRAFLLTQPDLTRPLSQPAQFAKPGYYPTNFRIKYDAEAKEYRIALGGLTKRQ
ncbi:MAG: DUF5602 domain-containing protein [Gemmatimonadaceae bacterium]|nr:DUF5602 domain-containing protein [Gemmatimonadaceae bacterium]